MRHRQAAIWLAGAALLGMLLATASKTPAAPGRASLMIPLELVIADSATLADTPRIGLNLGQWTSWGAEQLSRNILKNPGFEGSIDRALVRATDVHRHGFSDDESWLARADGFWAGASFEVLTGTAVGQSGRILDSVASHVRGRPAYQVAGSVSGLAEGDIVALTRIRDDLPPARWWLPKAGEGTVRTNPTLLAPGSPGLRSLGLHPASGSRVRVVSHLDAIGERAGKLLPVRGPWRLGLWVHGPEQGGAHLQIRFHRHGSLPFLDLQHPVEPGWHYLEHPFEAADSGPVGPLEFILEVRGGVVHVDDVWLGPVQPAASFPESPGDLATAVFNPQLIRLLEQLRPGYLRDWQGQLGDTLDNRLAPPFARRSTRYRPGDSDFSYGLAEFFDLSRHVGAQPWLILPTTFSAEEARQLGAWIAARIADHGFEEVIVEFGNENWNAIFRPAGIQDPAHHGAAADRAFAALRDGAENHPAIRTAINAQHVNPHAALRFASASEEADILALAPYFLHRLDARDRDRELELLFAGDGGHMARILAERPPQQQVAVYEINLHTTRGDLPRIERDAIVTSTEAGVALAQNLLHHLNRGIRRQNVYRVTGYDTFLQDRSDLTELFGIARDLAETSSLRPTGTAVQMLNHVIGGNLHALAMPTSAQVFLTASAFRHDHGWAAAVVSASPHPQTLRLRFPADGAPLPTAIRLLGGPVSVAPTPPRITGRTIAVTLPPFSLLTLEPGGAAPVWPQAPAAGGRGIGGPEDARQHHAVGNERSSTHSHGPRPWNRHVTLTTRLPQPGGS
ncbi:MAG: hypothetical protein JJU22_04105 [Gammaproteobacteria bacterium]|nr:hypothetical protein [Gammaproteobacteria bacterium]